MTWLQGAVHARTLLTFFRASRVSRLWRNALRRAAQACHVSRQQPSLQVRWCTCAVLTACQATRQACRWRQPCTAGESRRLPEGCGTEVWEPSALTWLQEGPRQSTVLKTCSARPVSDSVQLPYETRHICMLESLVEADAALFSCWLLNHIHCQVFTQCASVPSACPGCRHVHRQTA